MLERALTCLVTMAASINVDTAMANPNAGQPEHIASMFSACEGESLANAAWRSHLTESGWTERETFGPNWPRVFVPEVVGTNLERPTSLFGGALFDSLTRSASKRQFFWRQHATEHDKNQIWFFTGEPNHYLMIWRSFEDSDSDIVKHRCELAIEVADEKPDWVALVQNEFQIRAQSNVFGTPATQSGLNGPLVIIQYMFPDMPKMFSEIENLSGSFIAISPSALPRSSNTHILINTSAEVYLSQQSYLPTINTKVLQ